MVEGESEKKMKQTQSSSNTMLNYFQKSLVSSSPKALEEKQHVDVLSDSDAQPQRKPGGWRAMPFILGNETFERLAAFGLLANFMVYLTREYHMEQVSASNIIYIWSGVTSFAPLVGAFICDAYAGRFRTIAVASFSSLMGMATLTLTAWIPHLHPPPCTKQLQSLGQCKKPSQSQLAFLLMGLGFLSIGSGGIRPCSIPFGVDQFDPTTDEGRKGINSFFNWYYTSFTIVLLITQTLVVYIQDSVSWVLGFGIPTMLMLCSIILFFCGTNIYVHAKLEDSIFSSIAQVFVAAHKKRRLPLPTEAELLGVLYDPPLKGITVFSKLPLTKEFSYFTKAAIILENEVNPDGTPINKWRLCSVQQVEEVKRIIRIIPIWASGIIGLTAMTQQGTFIVSQALKMDRHLGHKFQVPAGSINVISFITVGLWLPFYDRILVPALRKITKQEGGITLLQRMGIGIVFSVLSMVVSALVERERRAAAILHPHPFGLAPMSVFWLAPQLILLGFSEAFNVIGQIEFFNRQFPEHMISIGNALFSCSFAFASYLSSLIVTIIHHVTAGSHDHSDWLANDINAGRLDYFFFLLAGIGVLNFLYFLYVARRYVYKGSVQVGEEKTSIVDVELSSLKA